MNVMAGMPTRIASAISVFPPLIWGGYAPHSGCSADRPDRAPASGSLFMAATPDTYVLAEYTFDHIAGWADPEGWISVDRTEEIGTFFHIDDFSGLGGGSFGRLTPLEGSRSLWCGARTDSASTHCYYACLPGYGNSWDQRFESVNFPILGDVEITFYVRWDSEPSYDYSYIEYMDSACCWQELAVLDGIGETTFNAIIPFEELNDSLKFRFRFSSDGAWSDEDCLWNTDGALIIDSLVIVDATGIVDFQDFEDDSLGATRTSDGKWRAVHHPLYGNYAGLFHGTTVLQEDPCQQNLSYFWGFFSGSTRTYAWNGFPGQLVVPYGPGGECSNSCSGGPKDFIHNEIWSPQIDWARDRQGTSIPSTAAATLLEYDVYRDLRIEGMVFYRWAVRSVVNGCPGPWKDRNFVYYGIQKDWYTYREDITDLIKAGADTIQVALTCRDMCDVWCGGSAICHPHSHAPLFDNIRLLRIDSRGPRWTVSDLNLFQDNFPADGTVTGTVKMDVANDLAYSSNPLSRPGDSLSVGVFESNYGLDTDQVFGGEAVYIHVRDVSPAKSGEAISGLINRWPVVLDGGGAGWTVLRMDKAYSGGNPVLNRFCVDLCDTLYTPGDTIWFYLSARDAGNNTTYWSRQTGTTHSEAEVITSPMEVTCLPANALTGATDILYVDDFDGRGAQPYFDTAFELLAITPDRYDVRGPASFEGNGPGMRVVSTANQIIPFYKKIIWNSGNLTRGTISDGVYPDKSNDFRLLYAFLNNDPEDPGVYISGDNIVHDWRYMGGSYAISMKETFMNFSLVSRTHFNTGEPVSPLVIGLAGSMFDVSGELDTLIAFGGCPDINDFDVLLPAGSARLEMAYSGNSAHGAILSQDTLNNVGATARVVLSGFSFHEIVDDKPADIPERVRHLHRILDWLGNILDDPSQAELGLSYRNQLQQNYPNPFNPTTTIRYSIKERGRVSLKIYNAAGQLVRTLVNEVHNPAHEGFTTTWNGRNEAGLEVSSGVYFYRLTAPGFIQTRKLVLLK